MGGAGAGGVVAGAVAVGLPGTGPADGVADAVVVLPVDVADVTDGEAVADGVSREPSGVQALKAASPVPASSRRLKARLPGVPGAVPAPTGHCPELS